MRGSSERRIVLCKGLGRKRLVSGSGSLKQLYESWDLPSQAREVRKAVYLDAYVDAESTRSRHPQCPRMSVARSSRLMHIVGSNGHQSLFLDWRHMSWKNLCTESKGIIASPNCPCSWLPAPFHPQATTRSLIHIPRFHSKNRSVAEIQSKTKHDIIRTSNQPLLERLRSIGPWRLRIPRKLYSDPSSRPSSTTQGFSLTRRGNL